MFPMIKGSNYFRLIDISEKEYKLLVENIDLNKLEDELNKLTKPFRVVLYKQLPYRGYAIEYEPWVAFDSEQDLILKRGN